MAEKTTRKRTPRKRTPKEEIPKEEIPKRPMDMSLASLNKMAKDGWDKRKGA